MTEITRSAEYERWLMTPIDSKDDYGRLNYELPGYRGRAIAVRVPRRGKRAWFVNINRGMEQPFDRSKHIIDNLTKAEALAIVVEYGNKD